MLGSLAAMSQLQRLTLYGLEYNTVRPPQTLPEISTSVTHLALEVCGHAFYQLYQCLVLAVKEINTNMVVGILHML